MPSWTPLSLRGLDGDYGVVGEGPELSESRFVMNELQLPAKTSILGIGVARTTYDETAQLIVQAGRQRKPLIVSALAVHGLMNGVLNPAFGAKLNQFDIVTPDGQPVRWALNWFGAPRVKDRVYGPTLMLEICKKAEQAEVGVYFFGSKKEVLDNLVLNLTKRFSRLIVSGAQPDRFREATPEEDTEDVRRISDSGAGIVFCGRGCPRQEEWCYAHRNKMDAPLVTVGAAFDFHAGTLQQAPSWMQNLGLEWLFRLIQEPRRLWKRYMLLNPLFILCIFLQAAGICNFTRAGSNRDK